MERVVVITGDDRSLGPLSMHRRTSPCVEPAIRSAAITKTKGRDKQKKFSEFLCPLVARLVENRMKHTGHQQENIRYVCDLLPPAASPGVALDLI